jgi:Cof subfamily protein (haloacid dehalogenase superfamily)
VAKLNERKKSSSDVLDKGINMKYKMIAIDLDGPLVDRSGMISISKKEAVRKAIDSGMKVTLATGRMYQPSARFAEELGIHLPIICYQGGLIRELHSNRVLRHKPLSLSMSSQVIERMRQMDVQLFVYVDDELYVEKMTEKAQRYAGSNRVKLNFVKDMLDFLEKKPTEIVAWGEPEEVDRLTISLKTEFGSSLLITRPYPFFCEIAHPESGKGNALKYLAQFLEIEQRQTVAIGDSPNDISMLEWSGLGIAVVPGATAEVIAAADWVVDVDAGDGFAEMMDKLLNS